jgi:hypothetical protein
VKIAGLILKPAFALGSWVAFSKPDSNSTVMGDLVLLEREVPGVIGALQRGGIQATALHNHLLNESPHVMYLHIAGHGNPGALAQTIHTALATTGTPLGRPSPSTTRSEPLDTAAIVRALGRSGKMNGVVYQIGVPRRDPVTMDGETIPASMGLATAINFQSAGAGRVAITGDFVMTANEVNPVIAALRTGGVAVTAIHSHMLDESPKLFFAHFWAVGPPSALSATLKSALGEMAVK